MADWSKMKAESRLSSWQSGIKKVEGSHFTGYSGEKVIDRGQME